uniref:Uncharacterized protein n=1 Tax=Candidatus Kentrum sp. FM TaxID=2126340 RepID=A0A450SYH5_9GAMM|nr:MAG: hypothetical protein BECKFM1743A_GA0114220_102304 [Candidatus Kentron sp. FM]VFJ65644.1 MAG: hypothetical protein BECKFM1743C_GA0114222_104013 [Candidatus Kentron sp. FM]VFK17041.1 MAG: hypothetical protein BECKFM1743B_GA0114221_104563 [Candidatus Kentron sp. FM]
MTEKRNARSTIVARQLQWLIAPAARLESERESCAIWYILFCQSPKSDSLLEIQNTYGYTTLIVA